jgi:hypothetical protein
MIASFSDDVFAFDNLRYPHGFPDFLDSTQADRWRRALGP